MRLPILILLAGLAHTAIADDWLYLTYPGDTPLKIGRTYLKNPADWDKVLKYNHVATQYVLPSNTRIRIPVELLKVTPAPVLVSHVAGNVRVKPADGPFRPLAVGDKLSGGETVLTGPNSFASFQLADGSQLSEQASSKLRFGRLAAYGKTGMVSTELDLQSGRLEAGASKQIGPAGGFKVVTPVAVAGLRGTAFRLNVSEDGKVLRNEVLEGVVGVDAQGQEVLVARGEGTLAELGKPPEPPRPLLPAPDGSALPDRTLDLPLHFAWPDMPNARGWRAQVAADAGFREILLDTDSDQPSVSWQTDLPDGHYFLRIRAVDAAGLEGLNTDHGFELDARPLPPLQMEPSQGSRVYTLEAALSWAASPEAQGYLLQISDKDGFPADSTIERTLGGDLSHTEKLAVGTYFWRIASLDASGPHGWSPVRSFRVQPPPGAPPGKAATRAELGLADFAWQAAEDAAGYDLQVARSDDFAAPEIDQHVEGGQFSTPLKPGHHFWRLRSVEADGHAGAWGKASPLLMPPITPADVQVRVDSVRGVHISWRGAAPSYRLEFARDAAFSRPLFNHLQVGNATRFDAIEPGQYWVRVIALSEDGGQLGSSQPVGFSVFGW